MNHRWPPPFWTRSVSFFLVNPSSSVMNFDDRSSKAYGSNMQWFDSTTPRVGFISTEPSDEFAVWKIYMDVSTPIRTPRKYRFDWQNEQMTGKLLNLWWKTIWQPKWVVPPGNLLRMMTTWCKWRSWVPHDPGAWDPYHYSIVTWRICHQVARLFDGC